MKKILIAICALVIPIFLFGCKQQEQPTNSITTKPMQKVLVVIAPEGYQDIEYETPKEILEKNGYQTVTASTKETAKGSLGGTTKTDLTLDKVNPDDYVAIVFIGGPGSHFYFDYKPALALAKTFYDKGKLTTAICSAPSILANAEILENKTVTAYPDEKENIENHGGKFTGNLVEKDGLIITGNGPAAAKSFGNKIVEALKNLPE